MDDRTDRAAHQDATAQDGAANLMDAAQKHVRSASQPRSSQAKLEARLDKQEATLRLLSQTVTQLATAVERSTAQRPTTPPATAPASHEVGEPASQDELTEWVYWLIEHYSLSSAIPRCWAQHPGVVEELDALRLGWLATIPANRPGLDALNWHEHLRRTVQAMDKRSRQCMAEHQTDRWTPDVKTSHQPPPDSIDLATQRYTPPGSDSLPTSDR